MLGYGINDGQCNGDNQILLGNTAITQIRSQVTSITAYSDKRFKNEIKEDVKGLDFIMRLKPVTYYENPEILHQIWGTPDSIIKSFDFTQIKNTRFIGFIAQDVEIAAKESGWTNFPGIDIPKNDKEVYSLRYGDFIMPAIKAIQEQQQTILKQQEQINAQQQTINDLKTAVQEMQQQLNKLENK